MRLIPSSKEDLITLRSWFQDPDASARWGGPGLRFPIESENFLVDIRWGEISSWSLVSERDELLGFGQYYLDHGYCRLARLAVAPGLRGQGIGRRMTAGLMRRGCDDLGVARCCLFVLADNVRAIACYRSLGFVDAEYPGWQAPLQNVRFMIRDSQTA